MLWSIHKIYRNQAQTDWHIDGEEEVIDRQAIEQTKLLIHVGKGLLAIHSELHSITLVATKVYVILRSFVVLTWMHYIIDSV